MTTDQFESLRWRAEEILKKRDGGSVPEDTELLNLLHELEVHQIELRLQNEELVRTRRELAESRDEYKELYDSAPVGFVSLNSHGFIEKVNGGAIELLDLPKRLLTGRAFGKFIHPEDQALYFVLVQEATAGIQTSGIFRLAVAGSPKHIRIEISGRSDAGGRLALIDVTRMMEAEKKLREAQAATEMRVQERTAELSISNKALRDKAARIERFNKELEEFTWITAHDLQEPLRKIQTFGDRLKVLHPSLDVKGQEDLQRIIDSAKRMSSLIHAVKSYSDTTKMQFSFEPTDLSAVAREVMSDLEIVIQKTETRIEVSKLPSLEVNRTGMWQLFQNLIGNSIKYAKENERPRIKITGWLDNGMCRIHVEDNGIGFEEKYLKQIFQPFRRLHHKDGKHEGTGMGLAICRKIVEMHGGAITAESTPGVGSKFIITLPVRKSGKELLIKDNFELKRNDLLRELYDLNEQLSEKEEVLSAIREGQIDALICHESDGEKVYTLKIAGKGKTAE